MLNLNLGRFASGVIHSFVFLVSVVSLRADSYNFQVTQNLPCIPSSCTGSIGITGTITVDQLGTLGLRDFTAWNLSIGSASNTALALTEANSSLNLSGSPQITATSQALTFEISKSTDGFAFTGPSNAQWMYGNTGSSPIELATFSLKGLNQTGFQALTLPSTLTAERFGAAPTPEPASFFLMISGAALVFLLTKMRKIAARS